MKATIKYFDKAQEYYFQEGCFITEVSNSSDDEGLSIVQARVEPGRTTAWHFLTESVERYVILEGCGEVELGKQEISRVKAGDVVIIPAGMLQRITNNGKQDLKFLAICSPRFKTESYREG
ncbi:MAG: cupin [SAR86 cluster bacterium]|uniref:Cupin n=1 Tax=SAR86 cluster bacterium TaxID=2030880 RepID=A0A2A4MGD1_9GAMM|nr:MAG: cupin [SAR86 cluster bacterium]